jgi:hypothetical protein
MGIAGIARPHAMIGQHLGDGEDEQVEVVVRIETERGPWMQALLAAGNQVYAINPLQLARYRQRHGVSGAKSDAGDAHTLADMVRTDRHQLRPVAGDSDLAEAINVVTRGAQDADLGTHSAYCGCVGRCWTSSPPRWTPLTTWTPRTPSNFWGGAGPGHGGRAGRRADHRAAAASAITASASTAATSAVNVTNPGGMASRRATAAVLEITGQSGLTYRASGLPAGFTIDGSGRASSTGTATGTRRSP